MRQGAQNIQKIGFHEPQNHRKAGDIATQFNGFCIKPLCHLDAIASRTDCTQRMRNSCPAKTENPSISATP